jgi:hypothetical protein
MRHSLALALAAALALAGCTRNEPLSLHGAGSMRVEVEVYKGPLSVPIPSQLGELVAVMSDTVRAASEWQASASRLSGALGCTAQRGAAPPADIAGDCAALESGIASSGDAIGAACYILDTPVMRERIRYSSYLPSGTCGQHYPEWKHIEQDREKLDKAFRSATLCAATPGDTSINQGDTQKVLRCQQEAVIMAVQNLASLLRAASFRVSHSNLRYVPRDQRVRASLASFGFIGAEYGNQLQSRIAVLGKQLGEDKLAANLPVSDFLRDASTTSMVHLFDWLDATDDRAGRSRAGGLDPSARVRMVERLTGDYYWEKINEVHASGQGDVAMAFIKDDLGNWNLKSFSNDPRALLRSYRRATDAAITSAIRLASKATNVGTAGQALDLSQRALGLANQFASGRIANNPDGAADADRMSAAVADRIENRRGQFVQRRKDLEAKIAPLQTAADQAKAAHDAASSVVKDTGTRLAQQQALCTAAPAGGNCEAATALTQLLAAQTQAMETAAKARDETQAAVVVNRAALESLPREAIDAVRTLLADHQRAIAALQESVVAAPPATPTPADNPANQR